MNQNDTIRQLRSVVWLLQREIKETMYNDGVEFSPFIKQLMTLPYGKILKADIRSEVARIQDEGWSKREEEIYIRDQEDYYEYLKGRKNGVD